MTQAVAALRSALTSLETQLGGLEHVAMAFGLSRFERDVLLLAAGCELDTGFAECVARAHDDPALRLPTLRLALAALAEPAWEALLGEAPLRLYALIELLGAASFVDSPYRVPEPALHALLGVPSSDDALRPILVPSHAPAPLTAANEAMVHALADGWSATLPWPAVILAGDDGSAQHAIASALAAKYGLELRCVDATALPDDAPARERAARVCERDCILQGLALLVDLHDELEPLERRSVLHWLDGMVVPAIICAPQRVHLRRRPARYADVDRPLLQEQCALWREALGDRAAALNGELDRVAAQFSLDSAAIARVAAAIGPRAVTAQTLWDAVRHDARVSLDDLAQRLPHNAGWDRLILPREQLDALTEIVAHVRRRALVNQTWGFARDGRGLGVSALFAGPSGTGKTLAAEVLASELALDAYRIDLSGVVSKYIGETEKNLRRVFDAAEAAGAVLVFDEADALFGHRSEVHDSHDRYANVEVSYLLQRMESYCGLAILTTNFRDAIDDAFMRRLSFVIDFPFPDAAHRAAIWRTMFPPQMPREELSIERLAQLSVPGGNIRNIAYHAAFIAADAGRPVAMEHLRRAARTEYAKLERPLGEMELLGWP